MKTAYRLPPRLPALLLALALPVAADTPQPARGATVAKVGVRRITLEELEARAWDRMIEARTREYDVKRRVLEEIIADELVAQEAARRKTTVDALVQEEVDRKVVAPTDWDKKAYYDTHEAEYRGRPAAEALAEIEKKLRADRVAQRRFGFLGMLRAEAGVEVALGPPRVSMDLSGLPSRGGANPRVTIVVFSEFQCPFCRRAAPTLSRLLDRYPGQVRLVFRHYPLLRHAQAPKAAEAAECAGEQGKFWEMHDRLFSVQDKLKAADLEQHAASLGLALGPFQACLDSGRNEAKWRRDLAIGDRYGLSGTPSFFVNGRLVVGALSYEAFLPIVEEELRTAEASGH